MKLIGLKERFASHHLFCFFFGHKIITTRNVTNHFKEFKCTICHIELTNDEKGQKTFLTPELKDINETLFSLYQKRHSSI
jgi:hypothetical protein